MRRESHGGFGGRAGETHRERSRHRALTRSYSSRWRFGCARATPANTASDHIAVLDEAIAQIPDPYRRDLLVTVTAPAPPST